MELFQISAARHAAINGHDAESTAGPGVEGVEEAVEFCALGGIEERIAVAGKDFAEIDEIVAMEMRDGIGVAVTGALVDDVDGVVVEIEGDDLGEGDART